MYKLSEIAKILNAKLIGNKDIVITNICIDSRISVSGTNTLFFALKGERHDGHLYLNQLYQNKIKSFIVDNIPTDVQYPDANFIVVKNTLKAFQKLASYHRKQFSYPVIGITGSNGKTIIKEWMYHCLEQNFNIVRSPKSYNSQVGVPLSVWLMNDTYNLAIFEAGISKPAEMKRLKSVISPDIGIFANIGMAHQENFKALEDKISEKINLFYGVKTLIYCKDHEMIDKIINKKISQKTQLITWGQSDNCTVQVISVKNINNQISIKLWYHNKKIELSIPFIDQASIENAIHCVTLLLHLNTPIDVIKKKMKSLPQIAMRLEQKKGVKGCTIINDSYNSDINSLQIALNYLNQQNQHEKKTLILSDILQSGKGEDSLYNDISSMVNSYNLSMVIGIGSSIYNQKEKFLSNSVFFKTTEEFLDRLPNLHFNNEAILLKGARDYHFEKISHRLEERTHRTVLEINLNALVHNLNYFRSKLLPHTKLMVMVKALSYGSGTYEIANILQYNKVDYLGVAYIDEGINLRDAGITCPIMVMNPGTGSFDALIEHNLEPEVYNFNLLTQMVETVKSKGLSEFPVHLKIDTGMHRLGFQKDEIDELIGYLKANPEIVVKSIFSHLAASDEKEHDTFTQEQISLFDEISQRISSICQIKPICHILNSAGIERFTDYQFDMVRLGIGLYGISSINDTNLQQVSTLKSMVSQIKTIKAGETVGYSRKWNADESKRIAIIPIGYADGVSRALSNGVGQFVINNQKVQIVGNVCMDMCMVDVTGMNVKEGDEVIIFGSENPVTEMAKKLQTIPYEIFTSIPDRVKKVYYQE